MPRGDDQSIDGKRISAIVSSGLSASRRVPARGSGSSTGVSGFSSACSSRYLRVCSIQPGSVSLRQLSIASSHSWQERRYADDDDQSTSGIGGGGMRGDELMPTRYTSANDPKRWSRSQRSPNIPGTRPIVVHATCASPLALAGEVARSAGGGNRSRTFQHGARLGVPSPALSRCAGEGEGGVALQRKC